jgi:hypothetical protein
MSTAKHIAFLTGISIVGAGLMAVDASALTTTQVQSFEIFGNSGAEVLFFNRHDAALGELDSLVVELESFIVGDASNEGFVTAQAFVSDEFLGSFNGSANTPKAFNASLIIDSNSPLLGFFTSMQSVDPFDMSLVFNNGNEMFSRVALCTAMCPNWYGELRLTYNFTPAISPVPVPAALPLLASAMAGLGVVARRRKGRRALH